MNWRAGDVQKLDDLHGMPVGGDPRARRRCRIVAILGVSAAILSHSARAPWMRARARMGWAG